MTCALPSGINDHIAGWDIPPFSIGNIIILLKLGPFSSQAMLVDPGVYMEGLGLPKLSIKA